MACPNVANDEITMLKTARERTGAGYTSSFSITNPIYMSDLQRVTGGNASGSGNSYPAVNTLNPINNQNVTRTAFQFIYSSSSSSNACSAGIPSGTTYFHTDTNNLVPDSGTGIYYAYTTISGSTTVAAGYYAIYSNDNFPSPTGKWMQVNNEGAIIGVGNC
jgi:hypothetical protein